MPLAEGAVAMQEDSKRSVVEIRADARGKYYGWRIPYWQII